MPTTAYAYIARRAARTQIQKRRFKFQEITNHMSTTAVANGQDDKKAPVAKLSQIDAAKKRAAYHCVEKHVKPGDRIGVGTGSTAKFVVDCLGEKFHLGQLPDIKCVPTSFQARHLIISHGLPLSDLQQTPALDVCIDGADEIDAHLNCIKGGGGALAQEKCVMFTAKEFYVVADYQKRQNKLGDRFQYIPLEVLPVAFMPVQRHVERTEGGECQLRMAQAKAGPIITDNGNYVVDWHFDKTIAYDWEALNTRLKLVPGLVETGLFLNVVSAAYLGMPDGTVCLLQPGRHTPVRQPSLTPADQVCTACQRWGGTTLLADQVAEKTET